MFCFYFYQKFLFILFKYVFDYSIFIFPTTQHFVFTTSIMPCYQSWNTKQNKVKDKLLLLLLLLLSHFSPVQLCATPRDRSPPGSPIPGILKAITLEWVAISFSNAWKWKVNSLSCVQPSATPWTAAFQAPPSMGFSRQEYWSGVPLPSPKEKLPTSSSLFPFSPSISSLITFFYHN